MPNRLSISVGNITVTNDLPAGGKMQTALMKFADAYNIPAGTPEERLTGVLDRITNFIVITARNHEVEKRRSEAEDLEKVVESEMDFRV